MQHRSSSLALALGLGAALTAQATVTGQWDFNSGDLSATVGAPLVFRGDTASLTLFGNYAIGGGAAKVMMFPKTTPTQGFVMTHGMAPNGGGEGIYVNQWTLIMDIMYPSSSMASTDVYLALLQTNEGNANDADVWIRGDGAIGAATQYHGTFTADTWHRLAFVVDASSATAANNSIRKFLDGTLIGTSTGIGQDGTFGLDPTALLFTDNDDETGIGYVNSIQIHDVLLSNDYIIGLGGATAAGIPAIPEPASGLLLGAGLFLFLAQARQRKG